MELAVSAAVFFLKLFENESREAGVITGFTAGEAQGKKRFAERRGEEVTRKGTKNGQSSMA